MSGAKNPEQLARWDREHVWHAFTQMQEYVPLIIERAERCTLIDVTGRKFLDGVSSLWCNIHGHRHPLLDAAIREQLDQVAHVTMLGMSNPPAIELARRLTQIAPAGLKHVFFSSDGSSAVEAALKMAFQYWRQTEPARPRKKLFVAFENAYHGDTLGSASVGGVALFHEIFRPLLFETLRLPVPDVSRLPPGVSASSAAAHYLQPLADLLRDRHEDIAAVVIEPLLQAAAGMIVHPPGFLAGVRELTRRYDVLLIADEIATGFGRTGRMFACEHESVVPDLLCLGKGLTAGYLPMSATLATPTVYQAFLGTQDQSRHFYHGHTYAGNCLAAAVAHASLDIFQAEATLSALPEKCRRLQQHLETIQHMALVDSARSCGLIGAIELQHGRTAAARVCEQALSEGVWLRPLGNVIVIMPPLCVTLEELDCICGAVQEGLLRTAASITGQ